LSLIEIPIISKHSPYELTTAVPGKKFDGNIINFVIFLEQQDCAWNKTYLTGGVGVGVLVGVRVIVGVGVIVGVRVGVILGVGVNVGHGYIKLDI
jgi:hypothetical protein